MIVTSPGSEVSGFRYGALVSMSFKEFSSSLSTISWSLKSPFPDVSRGITPFSSPFPKQEVGLYSFSQKAYFLSFPV